METNAGQPPHAESALLDAAYVSVRLNIPKPTLYERARREPDRLGVVRFGRKVMFQRSRIEALVGAGEG